MSVGKLGFFLSVIMIGVAVTSLILNTYLHTVINQLNAVNNQLNDEISEQTQIQDLLQILDLQCMEFQTISKGHVSGHKNSAYYVIENESEWAVVWNHHASVYWPSQPPPEIDFSKTMIIAVFGGEFTVLGYGIEIKEVIDTPQCAIVKVENTCTVSSGSWDSLRWYAVIPALCQPYHIIKMNRVDKEITFETVDRTS